MAPLFQCPDHGYTLGNPCPVCAKPTRKPGPAKYSPEDTYGEYRRRLKKLNREEAAARASAGTGGSA